MPWDESTRPRRPQSGPEVTYSERGREVGKHLIGVHDHLRHELGSCAPDRAGARGSAERRQTRGELNRMAMRQNDWTLGAFCSRYCVARPPAITTSGRLPSSRTCGRPGSALDEVIDRLADEHLAIGDALAAVDRALVAHINDPSDFEPLQITIDALTDALLSHLSYEERELVEPLARVGFMPGQV